MSDIKNKLAESPSFDAVWEAADEYHKRIINHWKERTEKAERALLALIRNPPVDSSKWRRDRYAIIREIDLLKELLKCVECVNNKTEEVHDRKRRAIKLDNEERPVKNCQPAPSAPGEKEDTP